MKAIIPQEIYYMIIFNYTSKSDPQKKNSRLSPLPAVLASLVLAGSLLAGCSGTGTMYTPDAFEDDSEYADTGMTAAAEISMAEEENSTADEMQPRMPTLMRRPAPSARNWKEPGAISIQSGLWKATTTSHLMMSPSAFPPPSRILKTPAGSCWIQTAAALQTTL